MNVNTHTEGHFCRLALFILAACLLTLPFLARVRPASAELSFCPPGSAAGQCQSPEGIATDFETGRLYVADKANNRVDVFKASDGEFLFGFGWGVDTGAAVLQTCTAASTCQAGISGAGAGQLSSPRWIAVDNVAASANRHDVYVVGANSRVEHFKADGSFVNSFGWGVDTGANELQTCTTASTCQIGISGQDANAGKGECQLGGAFQPVTVGPAGNVFVSVAAGNDPNFTDKVEKFSPTGACLGEAVLIEGNHRQTSLAVDSNEDAYVSDERGNGLLKYDLSTPETQLCDLDPAISGTLALALDQAGHLFAFQREDRAKGSAFMVLTEYDSACDHVRRFGYGEFQGAGVSLATYSSAEGDVFISEGANGIHYLEIPTPGPIVPPESLEANPIGNTKATVKVEVNPEGKATSYQVDYMTREAWEEEGEEFTGPVKSGPITSLTIVAGKEFGVNAASTVIGCPVATQQLIDEGKCLNPETEYVYRVVATNADNPGGEGEATAEGSFTTKAPIEIGDVFATEVGTNGATINAEVNPLGIPANGYFEYVDEATFQQSGFAEATRIPDAEAGEELIDFGSAETPANHSSVLYPLPAGTTYRYRLLADNPFLAEPLISAEGTFTTFRASSPESCPANEAFRLGAGALLPDCRAYEMVSPLDKANGDIVALTHAVLNQSSVSGEKLAYGSYRAFGDAKSALFTSQYIAARDPEAGWLSHGIAPPQEKSIFPGVEFGVREFRAFSEDLCHSWVTPSGDPPLAEGAGAGHRNLYRGTDRLCGGDSYEAFSAANPKSLTGLFVLELQGMSADETVAAFGANDSLEGSGAPAQSAKCKGNEDGACVPQLYMQAAGGQPRFVCILPGGQASKRACSAGTGHGITGFNNSVVDRSTLTNALSADGKRLFWSDSASAELGQIYLRENPLGEGTECSGEAAPCTVAVSKKGEEESGGGPSRFWAAAEDGSRAIFSTEKDLYEYDINTKATQKIAGGVNGVVGASENASHLYFESSEALTGDEENGSGDKAAAGKPNFYLRVAGPGSGSYRFIGTLSATDATDVGYRVSADGLHAAFMSTASLTGYDNTDAASGEADNEVFVYDVSAEGGAGRLICASCNPSGARPAGRQFDGLNGSHFGVAARIPSFPTSLYASRLLSDAGTRLFFESQDALVPRDTNQRLDVYEWEEEGTGGCKDSRSTFSPSAHGCIDLISSGQSLKDSEFLDASPSGKDVFFTTLSSLLPQDYGLVDIYDARVGGGLPSPPAAQIECEAENCQHPPSAPAFATPATATYEGPGDLSEARKSSRCPKGKRRAGKGAKSRCVAHKKAKKHRRANSHRRAAR